MNDKPVVLPALKNIPSIRAFYTTRIGGVSQEAFKSLNMSFNVSDSTIAVAENWKRTLQSQNLEHKLLAMPHLCHGSNVHEITGIDLGKNLWGAGAAPLDTDAIFTQESEWVLAVTMGDCLAILIADSKTRCISAIHAGWRGTRDNILGKTLSHLFSTQKCHPESTWISLSPCLSTQALEVSLDIAKTLPADHIVRFDERYHFDLRECNRAQALEAGVHPLQIEIQMGCTRFEPEAFFSYRRDGAFSGRMAACIAIV